MKRENELNEDLVAYNPKRWGLNIPFKQYKIRVEDVIPAFSGAIGKTSLVAAFAMAWATGLGISDPSFVTENIRLEIVIASLMTILFCAVLNPYAGPPGTLAPLIPIIPMMVHSGVHPLPLSILISLMGLMMALFKYFSKIVSINGAGTKGGIMLLFGFLGLMSSLDNLKNWVNQNQVSELFIVLLLVGIVVYIILNKWNARWLIIPACAVIALLFSAVYGQFPHIKTSVGFPILNPVVWWNEKWGIGWGLTTHNFINAIPFAILAVVMWPIDALAIKTIQEKSYPAEAKKAVFDLNSTYLIVSLRNLLGVLLGGAQIAAVWRSFMIPLGIVKRPIGGSALVLGIIGIIFGILGFPVDIAIFPPLLWLVLIFGVYIPLLEVGFATLKSVASAQVATICIITGMAVNPALAWAISSFIENFDIIKDHEGTRAISKEDRRLTLTLFFVTISTYLVTYFLNKFK